MSRPTDAADRLDAHLGAIVGRLDEVADRLERLEERLAAHVEDRAPVVW